MLVMGEIVQPVAVFESVLIIVASAVAGVPTWTERLLGKTAATNGLLEKLNSSALASAP